MLLKVLLLLFVCCWGDWGCFFYFSSVIFFGDFEAEEINPTTKFYLFFTCLFLCLLMNKINFQGDIRWTELWFELMKWVDVFCFCSFFKRLSFVVVLVFVIHFTFLQFLSFIFFNDQRAGCKLNLVGRELNCNNKIKQSILL